MILSLMFVVVMLIIGFCLRVWWKPLRWIYVPASIVGGIVGLLIVQLGVILAPSDHPSSWQTWLTGELVAELATWPGWLIAVVFAGMFLEGRSRGLRESLALAGREGLVVWIIVFGQTAMGLLVTWLLIQPFYDVPNSFGMLIETGFAGGHGTAGAMGEIYANESVGMENGRDLGIFMATMGLVFSVVSGVIYINIAIRRGWTRRASDASLSFLTGLENRREKPPASFALVRADVLDPMVFQFLFLASAFGLGMLLQWSVGQLADSLDAWFISAMDDTHLANKTSFSAILGSFPLFIYTLFGGLIVRLLAEQLGIDDLIDAHSIHRLTGAAMEFLVVSAITSLSIIAISQMLVPLFLLLLAAFFWTGFCLFHVARYMLPKDYWFELGIINYGMSTGTTATGFVLLKIVDEKLESGAAEDYALAAPLSAPFIGGGMLTVALPLLVLERIPMWVAALAASLIVTRPLCRGPFWFETGLITGRRMCQSVWRSRFTNAP